ncbi:MAG: UDP-N-acetylmuramate--L-alanine ligase, partial [Verrucomicrobiales bacterium]
MKESFLFIGVCGTAMGSVAAAMKARGYEVTGSDQAVYPPMSDFLRAQGIEIREGYRAEHIEGADIVVVGNAISRGNPEAEAVLNARLRYLSLPEVLKEYFLRGKQNLVVTGTHGKTTTSSLLAWLLESAGLEPGYMIGGIPRNLGRGARFRESGHTVLEGDEYDTAFFDKRSKFLHYLPEVVVVNNIEFDHADIYNDVEEIKLSFRRLLNIIPTRGIALINGDDANCLDVASGAPCPVRTVGLGEGCELRITDISYEPDGSAFTLEGERYHIPMVGEFNVRNAAMAICAARFSGIAPEALRTGLSAFEG